MTGLDRAKLDYRRSGGEMGAQRNHSAFLICSASVTTCNKRRLLPPWLHQERIVVVIVLMTLSDIVYRSCR